MNEINFKWRKSNTQFLLCVCENFCDTILLQFRTIINFGSGSDFLTNYVAGSGSARQKLRFLRFRFRFRFHNTALFNFMWQHQPPCSPSTLKPRHLLSDNYVCTIILYVKCLRQMLASGRSSAISLFLYPLPSCQFPPMSTPTCGRIFYVRCTLRQ